MIRRRKRRPIEGATPLGPAPSPSPSPSPSEEPISSHGSKVGSTGPSLVSCRSAESKHLPPNIAEEKPGGSHGSEVGSTGPSLVSFRSAASKHLPPNIAEEKPGGQPTGGASTCSVCEKVLRNPVDFNCGHVSCSVCLSADDFVCPTCGEKPRDVSEREKSMASLKEEMEKKFTLTSEGYDDRLCSLSIIYTELYIVPGDTAEPHTGHEFSDLELKKKANDENLAQVNHSDIFSPLPGRQKPPRTVLTKGSAGMGKSFSVGKFIIDWVTGNANQHVHFVFCLPFREINLIKKSRSLHRLITEFHAALGSLTSPELYANSKVIVILDGLDESRLQLDFEKNQKLTSLDEEASLEVLLVNLIQGNLLPDAHLWITSRPAAASQIPAKYVDMVTEIRGFNDTQKVDYFRRRYSHEPKVAERIILHIQSSPSLDIMCSIPIFCWISAILFQEVFDENKNAELPQTLTEMMSYYLYAQTKRRSIKYDLEPKRRKVNLLEERKEFLLKLGKLAFVHLQRNSLIFYEEDLEECSIDIKEATIYSGFCTMVLRNEDVFYGRKVFFFVHLTIQEFFAALYVYECLANQNNADLVGFLCLKDKEYTLLDLLKLTIDKVAEKKKGHLCYFLQFLLGLTVETNQRVLKDLLTRLDPSQDTDKKILTYMKSLRRKGLSPYSSIALLRAMVEMRDQKVKVEIENCLTSSDPTTVLSPLHCSALAYMLQVSKDYLDTLDLRKYNASEEGRRRLIPAVRCSKKAILAACGVSTEWIKHIAFSLKIFWTPLRELDLSNNDLQDRGVEVLCKGLSRPCCRLEILRLSGCLVSQTGCASLASALKANPSHLRELDLSYNHPDVSGRQCLSELKQDPQYALSQLIVENCGRKRMTPGLKKYACELTLDPNTAHKNLLLSDGNRKATWVEEMQPYHYRSERFDQWPQVLCQQGLVGRCYWEVDTLEPFNTGVTYKSICRKGGGDDCRLGYNHKSWSLICMSDGCFVQCGASRVGVSHVSQRSSRVGVYLDWPAGTLSFYRVSSDNWVHLHTVTTRFSEPLYPAVELRSHSHASFC